MTFCFREINNAVLRLTMTSNQSVSHLIKLGRKTVIVFSLSLLFYLQLRFVYCNFCFFATKFRFFFNLKVFFITDLQCFEVIENEIDFSFGWLPDIDLPRDRFPLQKNTKNGLNSIFMLSFGNCFDVFICAEKTESTK